MERRIIAIISVIIFISCGSKFETSESGVKYDFHKINEEGRMPLDDELALCYYTIKYDDTTLYSTYNFPDPARIAILPNTYKGDIFDALKMMHEGDSASFIFNAHNFYVKTFGIQKPEIITDSGEIEVTIKLFKVVDEDEYEQYLKREEKLHVAKEQVEIEDYIKENYLMMDYDNLTKVWHFVKDTDSNLIDPQDIVTFHCLAKTLDGETIINTYIDNKPITTQVGYGSLKPVILDEILQFMSEGSSGKFIVPYLMCFGPKGDGNRIPQYSTFVFDIFIEKVQK